LSEATPDNGCMYFLPKGADPGYALGDRSAATTTAAGGADSRGRPPPSTFALYNGPLQQPVYAPTTASAWQHVRAVPCTPGSAVFFSHRTVHWGSRGRPGSAVGPRVSISFAGSDHKFKVAEPYFDPTHLPLPPFRTRVALVAGQMLCYGGNDRFA